MKKQLLLASSIICTITLIASEEEMQVLPTYSTDIPNYKSTTDFVDDILGNHIPDNIAFI